MYVYMYTGLSRGPVGTRNASSHTQTYRLLKKNGHLEQFEPRWLAGNFRRTANYRPATYSVKPARQKASLRRGLYGLTYLAIIASFCPRRDGR